jgi:hypothetical protein
MFAEVSGEGPRGETAVVEIHPAKMGAGVGYWGGWASDYLPESTPFQRAVVILLYNSHFAHFLVFQAGLF